MTQTITEVKRSQNRAKKLLDYLDKRNIRNHVGTINHWEDDPYTFAYDRRNIIPHEKMSGEGEVWSTVPSFEKQPVRFVPISKIVSDQTGTNTDIIKNKLKEISSKKKLDKPLLVYNPETKKYHIWNGTHRITGHRLLGHKKVSGHVYTLKNLGPKRIHESLHSASRLVGRIGLHALKAYFLAGPKDNLPKVATKAGLVGAGILGTSMVMGPVAAGAVGTATQVGSIVNAGRSVIQDIKHVRSLRKAMSSKKRQRNIHEVARNESRALKLLDYISKKDRFKNNDSGTQLNSLIKYGEYSDHETELVNSIKKIYGNSPYEMTYDNKPGGHFEKVPKFTK